MPTLNLTVKLTSADASVYAASGSPNKCIGNAAKILKGLAAGAIIGSVDASVSSADPVKASGTLTFDTVVATDAFVIGTITLTGTDDPDSVLHFDTSLASDALIAADAARAVNEHTTTNQIVTASASGDVLTITANVPGPVGNFINISSVDSTITASAGTLTSGAGGTVSTPTTYGR